MSLGKILKKGRKAKGLSLKDLSVIVNIPAKHLKNLEEEKWEKLPDFFYIRGYVLKIAAILKLSSVEILNLFKKRFPHKRPLSEPWLKPIFLFPKRPRVFWSLVGLGFLLVFVYLGFEIWQFFWGPDLILEYPPSDMVVSNGEILVRGRTYPQAEAFINGERIFLDRQGYFEVNFQLKSGLNLLEIIAQDQFRHKNILRRRIIWHP